MALTFDPRTFPSPQEVLGRVFYPLDIMIQDYQILKVKGEEPRVMLQGAQRITGWEKLLIDLNGVQRIRTYENTMFHVAPAN